MKNVNLKLIIHTYVTHHPLTILIDLTSYDCNRKQEHTKGNLLGGHFSLFHEHSPPYHYVSTTPFNVILPCDVPTFNIPKLVHPFPGGEPLSLSLRSVFVCCFKISLGLSKERYKSLERLIKWNGRFILSKLSCWKAVIKSHNVTNSQ